MFTSNDLRQLAAQGISVESAVKQINNFKSGFPSIFLDGPATVGNGIVRFLPGQVPEYAAAYENLQQKLRIEKFVPASGAATRMFKDLFEAVALIGRSGKVTDLSQLKEISSPAFTFISRLREFAFFNELSRLKNREGKILEDLLEDHDYGSVIRLVLDPEGLNYASLPKGLLAFHKDREGFRTPVDEHLVEGALYARGIGNRVSIHFTVSPEHLEGFKKRVENARQKFERNYGVVYNVTFSVQKPSTDTIAVDLDNEPFRNPDGSLLFRPAGHGALIENLNEIQADIIFIKNIDNVVPDALKPENDLYKKALAGYLLHLQELTFSYLEKIENGTLSPPDMEKLMSFAGELLYIDCSKARSLHFEAQKEAFAGLLNRPIRVCGMVKNEGEPGGGPFWVRSSGGEVSLQIVESSQVNMNEPQQKNIFSQATHFNPVDLVCAVKDYRGHKFDLGRFIDPTTGFISVKSKDGRELKAQELPGLWNGAMAGWLTVFVEVPLITFNPVKTVNDLLRKEHQ